MPLELCWKCQEGVPSIFLECQSCGAVPTAANPCKGEETGRHFSAFDASLLQGVLSCVFIVCWCSVLCRSLTHHVFLPFTLLFCSSGMDAEMTFACEIENACMETDQQQQQLLQNGQNEDDDDGLQGFVLHSNLRGGSGFGSPQLQASEEPPEMVPLARSDSFLRLGRQIHRVRPPFTPPPSKSPPTPHFSTPRQVSFHASPTTPATPSTPGIPFASPPPSTPIRAAVAASSPVPPSPLQSSLGTALFSTPPQRVRRYRYETPTHTPPYSCGQGLSQSVSHYSSACTTPAGE